MLNQKNTYCNLPFVNKKWDLLQHWIVFHIFQNWKKTWYFLGKLENPMCWQKPDYQVAIPNLFAHPKLNSMKNKRTRKIPHFYPLRGAYCKCASAWLCICRLQVVREKCRAAEPRTECLQLHDQGLEGQLSVLLYKDLKCSKWTTWNSSQTWLRLGFCKMHQI